MINISKDVTKTGNRELGSRNECAAITCLTIQNSRQRKFLGKREEVLQCYSCKGEFLVAVSTDDKYGLAESDWYWDKQRMKWCLGSKSNWSYHMLPQSVKTKYRLQRRSLKKSRLFWLLLSNCLNWKIYCDDHSSLWSTTAVQIHVYELFQIYFTSFHSSWEIWTQ